MLMMVMMIMLMMVTMMMVMMIMLMMLMIVVTLMVMIAMMIEMMIIMIAMITRMSYQLLASLNNLLTNYKLHTSLHPLLFCKIQLDPIKFSRKKIKHQGFNTFKFCRPHPIT